MSEMVMFNKRPADEGELIKFALSATYTESGIDIEEFSKKQKNTEFLEEGFLLDAGYVFEIDKPFIGFNISLTAF